MNSNMDAAGAFLPNGFSFSASALGESAPSAPSMSSPPAELSDAELLAATRHLVGRSNRLLASLLSHLAEVEARGIHRTRACSSLYTYCIYELRFSEDEAFRRVSAARLVRRFPLLLDAIATGALHLTGLLMLGPHLTTENLLEVLARAKHRTKKEIAGLVRMLDPLPDVPPRIEPLGPAPALLGSSAPTWSQFVGSMNLTRELAPGHRPLDWTEGAEGTNDVESNVRDVSVVPLDLSNCGAVALDGGEVARVNGSEMEELDAADRCQAPGPARTVPDGSALARSVESKSVLSDGSALTPLARVTPQRYKVQFTASEEYVRLVAEAEALLSHSATRATLHEIHLRAMRALVAELQRNKYAVTARPRASSAPVAQYQNKPQLAKRLANADRLPSPSSSPSEFKPEFDSTSEPALESEPAQTAEFAFESARGPTHDAERGLPRRRGRYVSAATRRAVFAREEGRCTYVAESGQRCRETGGLELHHTRAFARGGQHTEENLTLRCRAHNALAAEQDFGRELIELARESTGHESWSKSVTARGD